ncbi:ribosome maturation factor RimP [Nakamurella antarctica]|uniref:Ribosome maturation factor RimP n=1 Tax=Nakamurella antarctica TaxID=1902245 RepID=A0A3G8ZL93_9ACTN|nr:ribosome maturation factor RimP [Nakamurella antarctica]AZI58092.1 ribosome maturation factor RimP [Nakamurella antarctica]
MGRADEGRLSELASTVAAEAGYDLEEHVVIAAGRRRLVRIVIDSDHGVSLDAAADVSRALAEKLDALDLVDDNPMGPAAYTLEVTSPGTSRPLTEERHYRRARGRLVELTLTDDTGLIGRIRRVAPDAEGNTSLELLVDWESQFVPLTRIRSAKIEIEFNKMPASHAAILAADGFVDAARAVDLDDLASGPETDGGDGADDDFEEFDSVADFEDDAGADLDAVADFAEAPPNDIASDDMATRVTTPSDEPSGEAANTEGLTK